MYLCIYICTYVCMYVQAVVTQGNTLGCFMIKADDLWSLEDLEHPQNAVICSLARYQHFLKIQLKSAPNFWSDFAKLNSITWALPLAEVIIVITFTVGRDL